MKWSVKIARIADIGIYIHLTFLLLLGWVAVIYWQHSHSTQAMAQGIFFILLLFGCVVLHELGHALMARRYGIRTRDITLLPIGGVARLESMPEEPRQEFWVALAGPAVNVFIAALLYLVLALGSGPAPLEELGITHGSLLSRLMVVNIWLVAFNLLPAFPMDGGRVLRALLAMRLDYVQATRVAAGIGQAMALIFGFLGLFSNPFLVFIALFVWIGAAQESSHAQLKSALEGIPVRRAMITDFQTLAIDDTLATAVDMILSGSQHDFPVLDGARLAGILTRADLLKALAQGRQGQRVGDVMRRDFQVVDDYAMLQTAFQRLQQCDCTTLPIVRNGQLIGLLTSDNVGEFIMIQTAMERGEARIPAGSASA